MNTLAMAVWFFRNETVAGDLYRATKVLLPHDFIDLQRAIMSKPKRERVSTKLKSKPYGETMLSCRMAYLGLNSFTNLRQHEAA